MSGGCLEEPGSEGPSGKDSLTSMPSTTPKCTDGFSAADEMQPKSGAGDEGSAAPSTPIKDSNETSTSGALSSHSSGLDKAIDAAKQDDEEEDPDVRFLSTGLSITSQDGRDIKAMVLPTPFAAPSLQTLPAVVTRSLEDTPLDGDLLETESLSMDEQDLYKHMLKELTKDGTLSSEVSELLSELRLSPSMSSSGSTASCWEDASDVQKAKINSVMDRLRSRLPPLNTAQLSHFDSYGLLDLYNHHHISDSVCSMVTKSCNKSEPLKGHF